MNKFFNEDCVICSIKIEENNDIVVCPECGAPFHRGCFKKQGFCSYHKDKSIDSDNFFWKEQNPKDIIKSTSQDKFICDKCGKENQSSGIFCESCGGDLNKNMKSFQKYPSNFLNQNKDIIDSGEDIDGVAVKDIAMYIGENANYFIPRFREFDKKNGKKYIINLSCLFLDFYYFIYRKVNLFAIFLIILFFLMSIPSVLTTIYTNSSSTFVMLSFISIMLSFSIKFYIAFSFNYIYYKNVIKKIKRIKKNSISNEEYILNISTKGGVSRIGVFIIAFILLFVPMIISGMSTFF